MLLIENLTIKYGNKVILKESNFAAFFSELTVITGRSGIGKSTFLNALLFKFPCKYYYEGNNLNKLEDDKKQQFIYEKIAYIEQLPLFLDAMTINEHIHELVKIGYKTNNIIAEQLGISDLLDKLPNNLSGGEKIRIALYLSLMKEPDILILDEPTAFLDNKNTQCIIHILKEYAHSGHYVIVASHDKRLIENSDMIYTIINHNLITNTVKEDIIVNNQLRFQKDNRYRKINIHFSYRYFRMIMLLMIGFTLIILIYSSHLFSLFHQTYGNQLNQLASLQLLVYKPKYHNDYYSFEGFEYPFTRSEIKQLANIEHINNVNMHIDLSSLYSYSMFDIVDNEINEDNFDQVIITDSNQNTNCVLDFSAISYHSYLDDKNIEDKLAIHFNDDGVIISDNIYQTIINRNNNRLDKPNLTFKVKIPVYNATNINNINYDTNNYVAVNCINYLVKEVTLPIKGVLKETESLYNIITLDNSIFIENNVYKKLIDNYYPEKPREVYVLNVGGQDTIFYDDIPDEFDEYEIIQQVTQSPWLPNCLLIEIDKPENIETVINEIKKDGYAVHSGYTDTASIQLLNENNERVLITFFIAIVVITYLFYIYLKYLVLKENKKIKRYLMGIGLNNKQCNYIFQKTYFKNFLALFIITSLVLYLLIEIIVRLQIIPLIIAPKLEYFLFILIMSFLLEIILPFITERIIIFKERK